MRWALLLVLVLPRALQNPSARPERAYSAFDDDKSRRFDFWVGTWDVNLRMLQENGEFRDSDKARASIYSILEGRAILELWDSEPIKGFSLRYYDPESNAWRLWLNWPSENSSRTASFSGGFRHGRGDFFAEREREDGSLLLLRYSFNDITPFSLRWDDHYSVDGGKTWRPNWIMEFSRAAEEPEWPIPRDRVPTFSDGGRCTLESFRAYEEIAGEWSGTIEVGGGREGARLSAYRILDGCAVIAFVSAGSIARFAFMTFNTAREDWELDWLASAEGSALERFFGAESWRELGSEESGTRFRWRHEGDTLEYRLVRDGADEVGSFERR